MRTTVKIAQFGLGPIGLETLKLAATKPWAEIVGGVDIDSAKIGRDLAAITGVGALRKRFVYESLDALVAVVKPDVVLHTSVSKFPAAFTQLMPMAARGINVVSSCEELLFPRFRDPKLADRLDRACKKSGARMVGTGVNPGFVMDVLPLCLSGVSCEVTEVHVERVVNASTRREPLQRKIGSGMAPATFRRLLKAGRAGHAGLKDSLALLAHGLGWEASKIKERGDAVVASHDIRTPYLRVKKGQNCGIHQRAEATIRSKRRLTLDLKMYLDAPNPHDAVRIEGVPSLKLLIPGGVAGDPATAAALVNAIPRLLAAKPGLLLMTQLAVPRFSGASREF
jgi:4-hydroxy-tetrahydrodipicolinate reductase